MNFNVGLRVIFIREHEPLLFHAIFGLKRRAKYCNGNHFPNKHSQLPGKTDVVHRDGRCASPFKVRAAKGFFSS